MHFWTNAFSQGSAVTENCMLGWDPRWPLAFLGSTILFGLIWKIFGWVVGKQHSTPQLPEPKEPEEDKGATDIQKGEEGKGADQKKGGNKNTNSDDDGDGSDTEGREKKEKRKGKGRKGAGPGQERKKRQQKKKPGAGKREPSPSPQSPPQSDWLAPWGYQQQAPSTSSPYYSPRYQQAPWGYGRS